MKELQLLRERFVFKHIYYLKKLLFLHKLLRINNPVLKACYDMFSHSVEFTLLCYSFDMALDLCFEVDITSKVLGVLIALFIVVECHSSRQCVSIVFYFYCIVSVLSVYTTYGE